MSKEMLEANIREADKEMDNLSAEAKAAIMAYAAGMRLGMRIAKEQEGGAA